MPSRIHFSADDHTRIRLARAPDPMWEARLSMQVLQSTDAGLVFGRWRRAVWSRLGPSARAVLALAPPLGDPPDFLTPAAGEGGLEAGIAAVLATPRPRLRQDMARLARRQPLPPWARPLAEGDAGTLHRLADGLAAYHRVALAPYWARVCDLFEAERTANVRRLACADFSELLGGLHGDLVWRPPVLTVHDGRGDRDVHLGGRGILVLPSFFCRGRPRLLSDPGLPQVLVYPMPRAADGLSWSAGHGVRGPSLGCLLGRTRAAILESLTAERTTTEVAHRAGVSLATASHHAAVLREAGLIASRRAGPCVLHTATPLGHALLGGAPVAT
ncbi:MULTISPECIES: winged helix-turn-helix domain-containing protein [Streptomyces]|uniref:winged helix-turn-helix domain-containing protein n=1 Tax=Streptomyces TaxID=1883 RepID=UPI002248BDE2|nr:winged helix-turn-helix domain-containing protein [Streptomyces sp. JHD 1]MCX2968825.1 winged helix-turn-helix domain-containing protein [Streptomyces sp. JHD 1]